MKLLNNHKKLDKVCKVINYFLDDNYTWLDDETGIVIAKINEISGFQNNGEPADVPYSYLFYHEIENDTIIEIAVWCADELKW